jgi:hypothetical protein
LSKFVFPTTVRPLLAAATTTGAGTAWQGPSGEKTYQASGTTSAGAGAATILIQGSNDGSNWDLIGTHSLTLATNDRYKFVRANVTAISGTGAVVSETMGY